MGQLAGISPGGSIALGIFVGLLSTSVQSLGLTLQRKSHILEDEKGPYDLRRPPYRRRRWQLGMAMFVVANLLGSTIQITTLPLPVLSTLQASGLVFNSICATLILGEPFTHWSLGGTLLVCSGALLIAIFGAIAEPAHNLEQLLDLLRQRTFVLWMAGQVILVLIIVTVASGMKRIPSIASHPRIRLFRGIAYGCVSGILSAHSLLVAKSAVELLVRTVSDRKNQFNHWQSWLILLSLVTFALTQLYYLHRGLKLVSTSVLYPLVFCIYNIIAILDGLIYFRQTDRLSVLQACLIALGTVILLSGVLALSWRLNDEQTQPAVAQSALAPGLGFVEDTDNDDDDDEESLVGAHTALLTGHPMPPTTKLDAILGATRLARAPPPPLTEADEIWRELDDSASKEQRNADIYHVAHKPVLSPDSPRTVRHHSTSHSQRPFTADGPPDVPAGTSPCESTRLLRGGSAHHRKARRRSTGFPGFTARPSPRKGESVGRGQAGHGGGEAALERAGWWKLKWWGTGGRRKEGGDEEDGVGNAVGNAEDGVGGEDEGSGRRQARGWYGATL